MKVSLNWLKEYISVTLEPSEISKKLTMVGLEVEAVEEKYEYLTHVVVAKVLEVKPHPNAGKLSVCRVDVGTDQELQIVCGAPNVRKGMFAPCALEGAILPGDLKIKAGKLRGEVSQGMLCSASELYLNSDTLGIMDLEGDFKAGTPLDEALKLSDTVFEINLTPNRPDCLSMIGVAREIGAFTELRQKLNLPLFSIPEDKIGKESIHSYAKVEILDPDLCPRYSAGLLFDVKIMPSPFWMQDKLKTVGLTPINNVVDITNFVMLEMGQPLHAFDFDNVAKGNIIIRRASGDTEFKTLDSKTHALQPDMLMICDGERPVAIAGVMGGENSEITDTTTRVLIESAYFNPISIRKTAKITGIATDASHRFERGVDPDGTMNALKRAVSLIAELCDAIITEGCIDVYPEKFVPVDIELSTQALNIRLGTDFDADTIKRFLESVEFKVKIINNTKLIVGVPSFRVDVTRPEDLSEEVARLWGYDNIRTSYPLLSAKGRHLAPKVSLRKKIREILTGFSLSEVINYNFIHENSCDRLNLSAGDKKRNVETILNPISDQMSILRSSMLPGLLETMKKNISQQTTGVKIFEIGKIFNATQKGFLPEENEMVAGLVTGNQKEQTWYSKKSEIDFFDLKGVVEGFFEALMIWNLVFEKIEDQSFPYYQKGYAAFVSSGDMLIGSLGKIDAKVLRNFGIKQDAFVFDFDFKVIQDLLPDSISARLLPKFPSISRDITIIVNRCVTVGAVLKQMEIFSGQEPLIERIFLFDAFEGPPLSEDKKSLSFRIIYRSGEKTLKEKNIQKIHETISKMLLNKFDAYPPELL